MKFNPFESARNAIKKTLLTGGLAAGITAGTYGASVETVNSRNIPADENKGLITYIMTNKTNNLLHDAQNHRYYKITEHHTDSAQVGIVLEVTPENSSGTITYIDADNDGIPESLFSPAGETPLDTPEKRARATEQFQKALIQLKHLIDLAQ